MAGSNKQYSAHGIDETEGGKEERDKQRRWKAL
jgi:hypothetical protein